MSEDGIMLLVGVIILIFAVCYLVFLKLAKGIIKDDFADEDRLNCPKETEFAKIVDKREGATVWNVTEPNHIVFENGSGLRRDFAIKDRDLYLQSVIGDEGELTFAGRAFVGFFRKNKEN